MAGVRSDAVGDIQGSIETGLGLHHLGHQSEFKRGCRSNRVPCQCHDAGARHPYCARQEPGTTISRDNAQFDETLCECCSFRGYSDVTHTGEIKSGANRRSVDRRNHGNFEFVQGKRNLLNAKPIVISLFIRIACKHSMPGRHVLNISTGTKSGSRSEEHTSELQSLMRISYAVFCLKKKNHTNKETT